MKVAFYTLGCKVNQSETEYMCELFKNAGFEIINYNEKADIYVVNSCTVTSTADQKTRQSVRKFKRENPNSLVILTGCMPQAFPNESSKLMEADIVIGNNNENDILSVINDYNLSKKRIVNIVQHKTGEKFSTPPICEFNQRVRAFLKIEDGCDRFCSYCIIPKSRGRVRSKSLVDLECEVNNLANNGVKEIVLVGINLSAYGKGENFNIVDAVKICSNNKKILRVRLGSLEPDHMTEDILLGLSNIDKFCPQFHISLQSGCDKTLKNMNRHYSSDEYKTLCNNIRKIFNNPSITTDVMVGFHEETDNDFKESLNFVKEIRFEKVHVFPYSNREGTVASKKGDSVAKKVKEQRAKEMISVSKNIQNEIYNSYIGKCDIILVEEYKDNFYYGYTKNYTYIRVFSSKNIIGKEINVKITSVNGEFCEGEFICNID